jgi:hypothetical protein
MSVGPSLKFMKLLICGFLLFFSNLVYAQGSFVYDEHSKRDPFVPLVSSNGIVVTYDEDLAVNDLVLEGIVSDATGNNAAIVNGRVVKTGDQIGPYVVDVIADDHVEFLKGTERFVLRLKKGGM